MDFLSGFYYDHSWVKAVVGVPAGGGGMAIDAQLRALSSLAHASPKLHRELSPLASPSVVLYLYHSL